MSDSPIDPIDLDLRLLPDWLKEPAGKNPYANYEGDPKDRSSRRPYPGGQRGPSRGRPRDPRAPHGSRNGPGHERGERTGGGGRDRQGGYQGGSRDAQRPPRGPKSAGGSRGSGGPRDPRNSKRPGDPRHERQPRDAQNAQNTRDAATPQEPAIPFQVDFLPEPEALAALLQQIKGSNRAYPLYGVGRMFLNKPERHRVRLASSAPAHPLFQVGEEGPLYLNRAQAEREAFRHARNDYYREEICEIDPPKGNFTNVARCRVSGVLLGPTNHHGYQLALRRLYEARFSRRMDFAEFQRQIEVVNAPEIVEEWKKQASTVTLFHTTREEEAKEFKTLQEVEDHFRENYLAGVVRESKSVEISGEASRKLNERRLRDAVREAWEKERGFPAQIVGQIRPHLGKEGLHVWKHRKRILFISTQRPSRFDASGANISGNVRAILEAIEAAPKCTRNDLSQQLLKPLEEGCDEAAQAAHAALKTALAADLHWLLQAGHVIEFHDGTLDLPLPPKAPETPSPAPAREAVQEAAEPASEAFSEGEPTAAASADAEATAPEEPVASAATAVPTTPEVPESTVEAVPEAAPAEQAQAVQDTVELAPAVTSDNTENAPTPENAAPEEKAEEIGKNGEPDNVESTSSESEAGPQA